MPYAAINGQEIYFEDTGGDVPPVVLAHGFLMDHDMFAPQVRALRDSYRIITWDERGFGETKWDGQPFSYWDLANDCLGVLDHLGIDNAVIGGMSQGGFISLRVAITAPERVRALILLDTEAGVPDEARRAGEQAMVDVWLSVGPIDDLVNPVAALIIDDENENPKWIAKWRSRPKEFIDLPFRCLRGREDLTHRLGEITCPALVVHGTGDTALDMAKAEELAEGLPGSGGVVKVPGAHAANLTHPHAVNAAILDFLGALPTDGA